MTDVELAATGRTLRVSLVDMSGETTVRYTPLAAMCLDAAVRDDARIRHRCPTTLHAFSQDDTASEVVQAIVAADPDVVAVSIQGWNQRQLMVALKTVAQYLPEALIVIGGNHVSGRGAEVMRQHEAVEVVVNGEGERTFCELLLAMLDGQSLTDVEGLTVRHGDGFVTTPARAKSSSLTELPSPYSIEGVLDQGFDVALLETNRGCPYACSFCYWGGRIGGKIAKGDLERVRQDLAAIGRARVETVFVCDANFGVLPIDIEIAREVVATKERYGSPSEFHVNWAKNHPERVGAIIDVLDAGGVHTTATIALQTLDERALDLAGRTSRGRAGMAAMAEELVRQGRDVYCEMIFGLPGETFAGFRAHYDVLYLTYPILRIHPLWILPNTAYDAHRDELEIVTISPDPTSDYEAVLSHADITAEEMRDGLAFLLAHSILSLLGTARETLRLLGRAGTIEPSVVVQGLEPFLATREDRLSVELHALFVRIRRASYFERDLRDAKRRLLYRDVADTRALVLDYLTSVAPEVEGDEVVAELLRFESLLLPDSTLGDCDDVVRHHRFPFDPVELTRLLRSGGDWEAWLVDAPPTDVSISHPAGLAQLNGRNCDLTNRWYGRVVEGERAPAATAGLAR